MSPNRDPHARSLWEIVKDVSEEENPERIAALVKELSCLLKADEQTASEPDEAR
jgi:hypothetical protein